VSSKYLVFRDITLQYLGLDLLFELPAINSLLGNWSDPIHSRVFGDSISRINIKFGESISKPGACSISHVKWIAYSEPGIKPGYWIDDEP
jgi:hypothetical protein